MAQELFANVVETKNNKIINLAQDGDQYDDYGKYVSANSIYKTFEDLKTGVESIHPIGSMIIMSTNTNPSTYFGGSWELVSKKFRQSWITLSASDWTNTNATFNSGHIALYGDTMMLRFSIAPTVLLTESTITLGSLNLANYGLSPMGMGLVKGKVHSDGGDSTLCVTLSSTGTVTSYDSLYYPGKTHSQATTGQFFYIQHYTYLSMDAMPDNYCDRFYFRRVA